MSKFANNHPFSLTILILTITITIGVIGSIATPSTRDDVRLTLSGHIIRDGKQISLDESIIAKQGETIHYNMHASNTGEAINNFRAIGQIPAGTLIVPESAPNAEFSLDGKTFIPKPQIEVTENGQKKKVDAPVESYRAVALQVANGFQGEKDLSYEVRVK